MKSILNAIGLIALITVGASGHADEPRLVLCSGARVDTTIVFHLTQLESDDWGYPRYSGHYRVSNNGLRGPWVPVTISQSHSKQLFLASSNGKIVIRPQQQGENFYSLTSRTRSLPSLDRMRCDGRLER